MTTGGFQVVDETNFWSSRKITNKLEMTSSLQVLPLNFARVFAIVFFNWPFENESAGSC